MTDNPLHEDEFEPETSSDYRSTLYLMGGALAFVGFVAVFVAFWLGALWLLLAR